MLRTVPAIDGEELPTIETVRKCAEPGCYTILNRYNFGDKCLMHDPPLFIQCVTPECCGEAKKRGKCEFCVAQEAENERRRIAAIKARGGQEKPKCSCGRVLPEPDAETCKVCALITEVESRREKVRVWDGGRG